MNDQEESNSDSDPKSIIEVTEKSFPIESKSVNSDSVTSSSSDSYLTSTSTVSVHKSLQKKWYKDLPISTTFTESKNIGAKIPCERLYIKFEGNNPTGTQKDRISFAICDHAKKFKYNAITTATCGNFGASLAYAANYFHIPECHIYIPKGYFVPKSRMKIITESKAEIHWFEGTYEDAVLYSSEKAKENGWYDANPGMNGTRDITLEAYSQIAIEIYRGLKRAPDYVFCPVGNGSTLAGIHLGFKRLLAEGKIKHLPRIVAASTKRGNPIIKSFKEKRKQIVDLKPTDIHETKINEPLISWHSFDGQEALDALIESNGFGEYASDAMMTHFSKVLREEEGLLVHPASSSTLAVLAKMSNNNITLKGTFVVLLSARNV